MYFEQELKSPPDFEACRKLINDVMALFAKAGIYFQISTPAHAEEKVTEISGEWLEKFIIDPETPAFYRSFTSPDDVRAFSSEFIDRLWHLREIFSKYIDDNSSVLSAEMKDKIDAFAMQFGRMKKMMIPRSKAIERDIIESNSIEDVRRSVRKNYAELLKNVFDNVVDPIYEGMRLTPNAAYEFVLREVNEFLKGLGISTLTVELGEKFPDNFPYALKPAEIFTSDPDKKDSAAEIERYAYVFNEDRGAENFCLCQGSAYVTVYKN